MHVDQIDIASLARVPQHIAIAHATIDSPPLRPQVAMNYVVTAHPADAVSHALVGNFISEGELDLIVSKGSRLVIYSAGPEGLQPFKEVPMYGRIATMELWRPPGQKLAQLFVSTESNKFCILGIIFNSCFMRRFRRGQVATADPFMLRRKPD